VDEDISRRVASVLDSAYADKGYEFIYIADLTGVGAEDEFWAEKFRKFGGEIVLSADRAITKKAHKVLAFKENGLTCFFIESLWSNRPGYYKLCHALYWWHWIRSEAAELRAEGVLASPADSQRQ
jgi:hypothetical protein